MALPCVVLFPIMVVAGIFLPEAAKARETPLQAEASRLYAKEDWKEAAKAYESLTKEEATKPLYWFRLATCRLRLGDYQRALSNYEIALTHGAPEAQTRYNMACTYAHLGAKEAALNCLEKSSAGGFARARTITQDEDLKTLHAEPRFKALVEKLENPTKGLKGADALDHWIGDWDVYVNDQLVGKNHIVKALNGFAVEEFWESRRGGSGRSLFVFEAAKGRWKQLWTDDTGWIVEKTGTPIENGIYLEGVSRYPDGTVKKSREYLTRNSDGSVRQLLEEWEEESKEWKVGFDGKYVRKAPAAR